MMRAALVALIALAAFVVHAEGAQRFEGKLFTFSYPSSAPSPSR